MSEIKMILLLVSLFVSCVCEGRKVLVQAPDTHSPNSVTEIDTNAPVFLWNSTVCTTGASQAVFAIRLNISSSTVEFQYSSGTIYQQCLESWRGLYVFEGNHDQELKKSSQYDWTVEERELALLDGSIPSPTSQEWHVVGKGAFATTQSLMSAADEAAMEMTSSNVSMIWNTSWNSVVNRVVSSGFLPTSVSNGYGGITNEFVRDASGQIIGMLEIGSKTSTAVAKSALRFMLTSLSDAYNASGQLSYAPHVMTADKNLDKIISFDTRDQTDDTFYLISAWGRYVNLTGDMETARDFYGVLKNYSLHYIRNDARSGGFPEGGKIIGGGVLYWNQSLNLLWNPNLEHSRLGSYWSCYDLLTNSFAAEGLRNLAIVASYLDKPEDEQMFNAKRSEILRGIKQSLTLSESVTGYTDIYAELRGHPNDFSEDKGEPGYSPLLWGISYENIVSVVLGLAGISHPTPNGGNNSRMNSIAMEDLGLNVTLLDNTWDMYRKAGSFQWINQDVQNSAFVPTTHINSSGWINPPVKNRTGNAKNCSAQSFLRGKDALKVATGPDICDPKSSGSLGGCGLVSTPLECCQACSNASKLGLRCSAWFFNGNVTLCSGHGCCYMKSSAQPDHVTPSNDAFAGGYGTDDSWCDYTGIYSQEPVCPAYDGKTCACPSFAVIGKNLGWELGWAAYRQHFTRLITLHRWLGSAAHVEQTTLFAESYSYECMRTGEKSGFTPKIGPKTPRGAGCWGDPGNGVQIGWFLWGESIARRAVGLKP
eukprot:m.99424 g.99424  ORF g.99424 m.99424 type:complete len:763 (+) comp13674_c0_seq11:167-2455(+)